MKNEKEKIIELENNFTNIYIAKNLRTAIRLSHAFKKLWSSMDHSGKVLSQRKWQKYHKKIGLMLGYPKTAKVFSSNKEKRWLD